MTREDGDQRFVQGAKRLLDASTDELDDVTCARLSAARARAVEAATGRHEVKPARWLLPAGGVAVSIVAAVAFLMLQDGPTEVMSPLPYGDMDLLTAAEPLELFENLEFYEWLEAEASDAG